MKRDCIIIIILIIIYGANINSYAQVLPLFTRLDYSLEHGSIDIKTGDFNNDEITDIIILGSGGNISIIPGRGDGTFAENRNNTVNCESRFLLVDDFNNDSIDDIIIENKLLLGDGKGYFQDEKELECEGFLPPLSGDVNNDGYSDLLMLKEYMKDGYTIRELAVANGNGDGTFVEPVCSTLPGAKILYLLNIGDFNSDTIPDVLITYKLEYDEYGPLFKTTAPISFFNFGIMPGNGDGSFGDVIVNKGYWAGSISDFNNDGIIDVIGGIFLEPNFHVMLGDGNGTFNLSWQSPDVDYGSPKYFIFDVNSDNILDIGIFITSGGDFQIQEIMFFLGAGNGTFTNPVSFGINGFNFRPSRQITVVSDFNNDIFDDFIIAPRDSSYVSVFINNGFKTSIENNNDKKTISPFTLYQNRPNPFNNFTFIPYHLEHDMFVSLEIYDISGQKVRTLISEFVKSGTYHALWDGRNNSNSTVASGVYLCVLKGGNSGEMSVQKMVFVQ